MKQRIRLIIAIALVLSIGVVAFQRGWISSTILAQGKTELAAITSTGNTAPPLPRIITVVGQGTVKIKPDIAHVTIGVETLGNSVQVASAENSDIMDAVVAALKKQGVLEADMQTSGYSVWTERERSPSGEMSATASYRVNNSLTVVVRNLDKLSPLLDAAINAGANSIYGINFSVDQPQQLESQARSKAIDDAKAKAQELAELTDVAVGPVVSVSEVISGGGLYGSNFEMASMAKSGLGGGVGPINPGELELSLQLQVIYEIQ